MMRYRRSGARTTGRANRRGFTLVELMIAVVLLSVGMLALAGSAAMVVRSMTTATMRTRAATLAASRLDELRSGGCGLIAAGSVKERGVTLAWTVTPMPKGVVIDMTAVYLTGHGKRSVATRNVIAC